MVRLAPQEVEEEAPPLEHRVDPVVDDRPQDPFPVLQHPLRLRGEEPAPAAQSVPRHKHERVPPQRGAQQDLGRPVHRQVALRVLGHLEEPEEVSQGSVQEHRVVVHERELGAPGVLRPPVPQPLQERVAPVDAVQVQHPKGGPRHGLGGLGHAQRLPERRASVLRRPQSLVDLLELQISAQKVVPRVQQVEPVRVAELPVHRRERRAEPAVPVQLIGRERVCQGEEVLVQPTGASQRVSGPRLLGRPGRRLLGQPPHQLAAAELHQEVLHLQRQHLRGVLQRRPRIVLGGQPARERDPLRPLLAQDLHHLPEFVHLLQVHDQLLDRVLPPR